MIPLDVIGDILAFSDSDDTLNFLNNFGIESDFSDSSYINLTDARTKNLLNEVNSESIGAGRCQWINDKMADLTLPEVIFVVYSKLYFFMCFVKVLCNGKCKFVILPEPVNSFDTNDYYNSDPFNSYTSTVSKFSSPSSAFIIDVAPKVSDFCLFSLVKPLSIPVAQPVKKKFLIGKKRQRRRSTSDEPPCKSTTEESIKTDVQPIISPKLLPSKVPICAFTFAQPTTSTAAMFLPSTISTPAVSTGKF